MYTGLCKRGEKKKSGKYEWSSLVEMGVFLLGRANGKEKDKYWDQKMTLPSSRADNPGSTFLFSEVSYNLPKSCQVCIPRPEEKPVALDRAIDDTGDATTTETLRSLPAWHDDRAFSQRRSEMRKIALASQAFSCILYLRDVSSEIEGGFSFFSVAVNL